MNFTLQHPYRFEHLKIWFRENWHKLPQTLDTPYAYFIDVKKAVEVNIAAIEAQLKRDGKPNRTAQANKRTLVTIYIGLQFTENWNLPLKEIEEKKQDLTKLFL